MIVVRQGRARDRVRRPTDIDEVFQSLLSGRGVAQARNRGVWRPPLEVYESDGALEVVAEIGGMQHDAFEITIEGDQLTITGQRPDTSDCYQRTYHEARIPYGAFAAEVLIPFAIEPESASASYDNGFLRVTLPKAQGHTIVPRRVSAQQENRDDEENT